MLTFLLLMACTTTGPAAATGGPKPALVETATVRTGGVEETWSTLGDVVALDRAELAAATAGPVERVPFREGDPVGRGQLLLEVDAALAAAQADRARAAAEENAHEVEQARRTLARLREVDARVLAPTDLEEAETRLAAAEARQHALEAAAREAEVTLGRHRVTAPFAGVVTARHVDPGDWVTPGEPVVELVSTGAVEVRVDAAPELAAALAPGDPVSLQRDSVFGDGTAAGAVVRTLLALDDTSRTALVRVAPQDPVPAWMHPGSTVQVRFSVRRTDGGLVVPRDALLEGAARTRVFKVVDGTARSIEVTVLARGAADAVVRADDLQAGDAVVVRGNERLRPDQPVTLDASRPADG